MSEKENLSAAEEVIELNGDDLGNFDSLAMCLCLPIAVISQPTGPVIAVAPKQPVTRPR